MKKIWNEILNLFIRSDKKDREEKNIQTNESCIMCGKPKTLIKLDDSSYMGACTNPKCRGVIG